MRSFGRHTLKTLAYFTGIAKSKSKGRGSRLISLQEIVSGQFDNYSKLVDDLAGVTAYSPLTAEEREDLLHCYESPTTALLTMLGDIDGHHRTVCPSVAALCQYCGLNHDASDWDHYLPKSKFPEFAVLSQNLVPCCGRCNQLKGEKWLDAEGKRMFLSFYYDPLPAVQLLSASIRIDRAPFAEFKLSAISSDYGGLESTVRQHFTKLHLLQRYSEAAPNVFSEMAPDLGPIVKELGKQAAALLLKKKAEAFSKSHSPNYWKVPLYQAMAENDGYLESLGE